MVPLRRSDQMAWSRKMTLPESGSAFRHSIVQPRMSRWSVTTTTSIQLPPLPWTVPKKGSEPPFRRKKMSPVALNFRTGTDELWVSDAEGADARRLTRGGGSAARASTDGSSLYFTRPDEPGLWRLDSETAQPVKVWSDVHPGDWGNWTATAQGILYFRIYGGGPQLERLDFGTGSVDTLMTIAAEAPDQAGVTVAADGRILFGQVVRSESDLWIARGVVGR